jgi:hypothetical protein
MIEVSNPRGELGSRVSKILSLSTSVRDCYDDVHPQSSGSALYVPNHNRNTTTAANGPAILALAQGDSCRVRGVRIARIK